MNERPTPETDAFFRSFADGDATPSHAEYYDRMTQLERERDEARAEVQAIQHWATVNGTIQMQREIIELIRQRDTLAAAAKLIADEYEDRRCQFGSDPLWIKHEQTKAIENALAIINKHHHE